MKNFNELTLKEKIETNIFFKIGYKIGELNGRVKNYGELDYYYKYHPNVKSELTKNGRVTTDIIFLNSEIAEFANLPERIEIKSGAIKKKRDVFYKEKHTGNIHLTEPYEVMIGNGENMNAVPDILNGFFTKQCEYAKK